MKIRITLFAVCMTLVMFGQSDGKLFKNSNHVGGYGGVNFMLNPAGNLAFTGEGSFVFKNYYIGGHGGSTSYGSIYSMSADRNFELTRSMGGFMLGATSNASKKIALFVEARLGFGEVLARARLSESIFQEYEANATTFAPTAGICYNPNRYFQLRLYGGYEYTTDFDLVGITNAEMNGAVFGLALYFGYF